MATTDKLNREALISDSQNILKDFIASAKAAGIKILTEEERESMRKKIISTLSPEQDLWIFAYGSLMWNPTIEFVEEQMGEAEGWHRDFCIHAPIGRGSVENPSLMMGLDVGGYCVGKIYRIAAQHIEHESTVLWKREYTTGIYTPKFIDINTPKGKIKALAFTIDRENCRYRDSLHHTFDEQAKIIATGSGLYGSNKDYLFSTVKALRQLKVSDSTLEALAEKVRQIVVDNPA